MKIFGEFRRFPRIFRWIKPIVEIVTAIALAFFAYSTDQISKKMASAQETQRDILASQNAPLFEGRLTATPKTNTQVSIYNTHLNNAGAPISEVEICAVNVLRFTYVGTQHDAEGYALIGMPAVSDDEQNYSVRARAIRASNLAGEAPVLGDFNFDFSHDGTGPLYVQNFGINEKLLPGIVNKLTGRKSDDNSGQTSDSSRMPLFEIFEAIKITYRDRQDRQYIRKFIISDGGLRRVSSNDFNFKIGWILTDSGYAGALSESTISFENAAKPISMNDLLDCGRDALTSVVASTMKLEMQGATAKIKDNGTVPLK